MANTHTIIMIMLQGAWLFGPLCFPIFPLIGCLHWPIHLSGWPISGFFSAAGGLRGAACSEWNSNVQRPGRSALDLELLAASGGCRGPGPDIQKGQERRQKAGCGAALWTLSANPTGHCPLRAPACLQRAEAAKDLRALGCCRHRGIRGVSMRATFCTLQCCGSCLRLAVSLSLDRRLSEDKAPCSCMLGREQPGIVKFRSEIQS